VTVKASSALSIVAIWVSMIVAVVVSPGAWWALIFAFLATLAVGASAWRRLGLSRLIALVAAWAATALAIGKYEDAAWISTFTFLTTGAVVYSVMRRDALALGAGIGVAWAVSGVVVAANGAEAAWIGIFAFLTAGALANSRGDFARGLSAVLWWGIAGAIMLISGGWEWLAVIAFVLSAMSFGFHDFQFPRRVEWDLFERDDGHGTVH
jgi:hypothetical protein